MRAWRPWDDNNFNRLDWWGDDDDLDLEEPSEEKPVVQPVPASEDPDEELLTVSQIVGVAGGVASGWRVRKAIKSGIFPSAARRVVRPGRGGTCWTVCKSEVESWLQRLADDPAGGSAG